MHADVAAATANTAFSHLGTAALLFAAVIVVLATLLPVGQLGKTPQLSNKPLQQGRASMAELGTIVAKLSRLIQELGMQGGADIE